VTGERREIAIAESACDRCGLAKYGVTGRRVALHNALNGGGNQQISAHDAIELHLVEETFSSGEPPRGWSHSAPLQESKCDPECRSRSPFVVTPIKEGLMRASPEGLALVITSNQVGGRRVSFEVFGLKGRFTVGRFEQTIGLRPPPLLVRLAGTLEWLQVRHVVSQ